MERYLAFAAAEVGLRVKAFKLDLVIGSLKCKPQTLLTAKKKIKKEIHEKPLHTKSAKQKIPTDHTQKSPRESLHLRHLATAQKLQKSYMPKSQYKTSDAITPEVLLHYKGSADLRSSKLKQPCVISIGQRT